MIDTTKTYKTRSGEEVTDLYRVPEAHAKITCSPIRGVINGVIASWGEEGKFRSRNQEDPFDLVEVKEPVKFGVVFRKDQPSIAYEVLPIANANRRYRNNPNYKIVEIEAPEFP